MSSPRPPKAPALRACCARSASPRKPRSSWERCSNSWTDRGLRVYVGSIWGVFRFYLGLVQDLFQFDLRSIWFYLGGFRMYLGPVWSLFRSIFRYWVCLEDTLFFGGGRGGAGILRLGVVQDGLLQGRFRFFHGWFCFLEGSILGF